MELNATLIVQAIHFFVAYFIIDQLLLKSALIFLQAEDRKTAILEHNVMVQEQGIAEQTRHNEEDWNLLQKRLRAECPDLSAPLVISPQIAPHIYEPIMPTPVSGEAVEWVKELMLQKVRDAHR